MIITLRQILLTICIYCSLAGFAQEYYSSYFASEEHDSISKKTIGVHLYNNNFVKNNEYFGPFNEGITYIGSILQPEIDWNISTNFTLSAGWYFRHFYGRSKIETSLPVIRATYHNPKGFKLTIGQLKSGNLQHNFVEPLYSTDNYFTKNPEYGVQLLYSRPRLKSEIYMDWENFILPGENQQEVITGGAQLSYLIMQTHGHTVNFEGQSIIHHFGGQVDNSTSLLQTRANAAAGINYTITLNSKHMQSIRFASWYLQAMELSHTNTLPYHRGFATMNGIDFSNKYFKLGSAWFHGEYFFAPLGDPLFQSVSGLNDWYADDTRDIISSKLAFEYSIFQGIKFGFHIQSYFDIERKNHDFSYGINLLVDRSIVK